MMKIKDLTEIYRCMWCGKTTDTFPKDGKCLNCHQEGLRLVGKYVVNNPHFSQIIKISSAEAIKSMRMGNVWFQSPRYFQEYSGDGQEARADIHDAKYSYIGESGNIDDKNADTYRLLCFYSLNVNKEGDFLEKPSEKLRKFGGYYSIVDLETLLSQVKNYIINPNNKVGYVANWVNYLTEIYSGVYSPFCKFPEFSYQNEFRIVLLSDIFLSLKNEPYKTFPPIKGFNEVFSEPQSLDGLLHAENINAL
jgi:hypothetical protein